MNDAKRRLDTRRMTDALRRVAKPEYPGYCWAEKRLYIGQMFPSFTGCSKNARPGKLTCHHHDAWEQDAQAELSRIEARKQSA